jgi:hypothetical protein
MDALTRGSDVIKAFCEVAPMPHSAAMAMAGANANALP